MVELGLGVESNTGTSGVGIENVGVVDTKVNFIVLALGDAELGGLGLGLVRDMSRVGVRVLISGLDNSSNGMLHESIR